MKKILVIVFAVISIFLLSSCKKGTDYFKYVSECKHNIFLGNNENYKITASIVKRESPALLDGNATATAEIIEIFLIAETGDVEYSVNFVCDNKSYSGGLNYSSVNRRHELILPFVSTQSKQIDFVISYGTLSTIIPATSVLQGDELSAQTMLELVSKEKVDVFTKYKRIENFEISIRLLYYNNKCYYYVGLIDESSKKVAFLVDAYNGNVITQKDF